MKSAQDWLKQNKVEYAFHDYKTKGISREKLTSWIRQVGWESLVNKRGTTWRKLDEETQVKVKDENSAIELMLEKTSVIKRPLIEKNGKVVALGFEAETYRRLL